MSENEAVESDRKTNSVTHRQFDGRFGLAGMMTVMGSPAIAFATWQNVPGLRGSLMASPWPMNVAWHGLRFVFTALVLIVAMRIAQLRPLNV